jgi:hypothetical protein
MADHRQALALARAVLDPHLEKDLGLPLADDDRSDFSGLSNPYAPAPQSNSKPS